MRLPDAAPPQLGREDLDSIRAESMARLESRNEEYQFQSIALPMKRTRMRRFAA